MAGDRGRIEFSLKENITSSPINFHIVCSYTFPHTRHYYVLAAIASQLCRLLRPARRGVWEMTSGLFIGVSESLCDALGSSGARPRIIHDGGTPDRHCMLLSHTGIQLLCPACGVALGFLWAPCALLLCAQPCSLAPSSV